MNNTFENGVVMIPPEEYARLVEAKTLLDVEKEAHCECKIERMAFKIKLDMYEEWLRNNSYHRDCFKEWKEKEYGRD